MAPSKSQPAVEWQGPNPQGKLCDVPLCAYFAFDTGVTASFQNPSMGISPCSPEAVLVAFWGGVRCNGAVEIFDNIYKMFPGAS